MDFFSKLPGEIVDNILGHLLVSPQHIRLTATRYRANLWNTESKWSIRYRSEKVKSGIIDEVSSTAVLRHFANLRLVDRTFYQRSTALFFMLNDFALLVQQRCFDQRHDVSKDLPPSLLSMPSKLRIVIRPSSLYMRCPRAWTGEELLENGYVLETATQRQTLDIVKRPTGDFLLGMTEYMESIFQEAGQILTARRWDQDLLFSMLDIISSCTQPKRMRYWG